MSFSQEVYKGQGGVGYRQQENRVGEILGSGIKSFGKDVGEGIRKYKKRKSDAVTLRTKLAPHADSLAAKYETEPGDWKAYLDDRSVDELQGISEGFIVSMAKELHDKKVAAHQLEIDKVNQTGTAVQGILQANMPGDVPVDKQDYTDQIGKAKAKEERLDGMMRFAPKPEGSMGTDASLRYAQQQPMGNVSGPDYLQQSTMGYAPEIEPPEDRVIGSRLGFSPASLHRSGEQGEIAPGQAIPRSALEQEQLEQRARREDQQSNLPSQGYAQSMAGKAAQAREALGQLDEEISKPLEDVRNQLGILEERQSFEQSKPDSRPETAKEFSARRTKTLKKLIDDNPLAATTIYTALMGSKAEAPKLDAEARKAVGFAGRMDNAEARLQEISKKYDRSGKMQGILSVLPQQAKSQERRQYEAAMKDWVSANLRRESGAAINAGEYANDYEKYFPSAGDSAETIALKASLRQQAVKAIMGPIHSSYPTLKPSGISAGIAGVRPAQQSNVRDIEYGSNGLAIE